MGNNQVEDRRRWYSEKLVEFASTKGFSIANTTWEDEPDRDTSRLTIEGSGKRRLFRIDNFFLVAAAESELEQDIKQTVDFFAN